VRRRRGVELAAVVLAESDNDLGDGDGVFDSLAVVAPLVVHAGLATCGCAGMWLLLARVAL